MANETATTVKTIRADDETMERFRAISAEYGNQGQALAALVQLHESQRIRTSMPARADELDTYEAHLTRIREMYLASVQMADDANIRVKATYNVEIQVRDRTIADLQTKLDKVSAEADGIRQRLELATAKAETAEAKGEMIEMLNRQIVELRKMIDVPHKAPSKPAKASKEPTE